MNDPQRYLDDEHAEPLARMLLRSADGDGLEDIRVAALASRFDGVVVGEAPRTPFSPVKWGVLTILAALVMSGLAGSVFLVREGDRGSYAVGTATVAIPAAIATTAAVPSTSSVSEKSDCPRVDAVPVGALPEAPSLRTLRATPTATHDPVARVASSPSSADDLAAEVRALERVRAAIATGRAADAHAGLVSYKRGFPEKLLEKEARVLEIEALIVEGRRDEAEALANTFLASSQASPYAARIRSLLAGTDLRRAK